MATSLEEYLSGLDTTPVVGAGASTAPRPPAQAARGLAPFDEDPQGQYAIPTTEQGWREYGVPTREEDFTQMRLSPRNPSGAAAGIPTVDNYIDSLDTQTLGTVRTRTQTGGMGQVFGIGVDQLAQGLVSVAEMAGVIGPEARQAYSRKIAEEIANLSPELQRDLEAKWLSLDENSVAANPGAALTQTVQQLPNLLAMLVPTGAAAGATRFAVTQAAERGAGALARAELARKVVPAAVGGVSEGALAAGQTYSSIGEELEAKVKTIPLNELAATPIGVEWVEQGNRIEDLPAEIARFAGATPALEAGAVTAMFGAVAGKYFGDLLAPAARPAGSAALTATEALKDRARRAGTAAAVEGPLTEAPQSAQEQLQTNRAVRTLDPSVRLSRDVAEAAAAGAGTGGVMGGAIGAVSPSPRTPAIPAPPAAPPAPAITGPVQGDLFGGPAPAPEYRETADSAAAPTNVGREFEQVPTTRVPERPLSTASLAGALTNEVRAQESAQEALDAGDLTGAAAAGQQANRATTQRERSREAFDRAGRPVPAPPENTAAPAGGVAGPSIEDVQKRLKDQRASLKTLQTRLQQQPSNESLKAKVERVQKAVDASVEQLNRMRKKTAAPAATANSPQLDLFSPPPATKPAPAAPAPKAPTPEQKAKLDQIRADTEAAVQAQADAVEAKGGVLPPELKQKVAEAKAKREKPAATTEEEKLQAEWDAAYKEAGITPPTTTAAPTVTTTAAAPAATTTEQKTAPAEEKRGPGRPKKKPEEVQRRAKVDAKSTYEEIVDAITFGAEQVRGHRAMPDAPRREGDKVGLDVAPRVQALTLLNDVVDLLHKKTTAQLDELRSKLKKDAAAAAKAKTRLSISDADKARLRELLHRQRRINKARRLTEGTEQADYDKLSRRAKLYDTMSLGEPNSKTRLLLNTAEIADLEYLSLKQHRQVMEALGEEADVNVPAAKPGLLLGIRSQEEKDLAKAARALQKLFETAGRASTGPIDTVSLSSLENSPVVNNEPVDKNGEPITPELSGSMTARLKEIDEDRNVDDWVAAEQEAVNDEDSVDLEDELKRQVSTEATEIAAAVGVQPSNALFDRIVRALDELLDGHTSAEVLAVAARMRDIVRRAYDKRVPAPGKLDMAEARALLTAWFEDPNLNFLAGEQPSPQAMSWYSRRGNKDKLAVALMQYTRERDITTPAALLQWRDDFMNGVAAPMMNLKESIYGSPEVSEVVAEAQRVAVDAITTRVKVRKSRTTDDVKRKAEEVRQKALEPKRIEERRAKLWRRPGTGVERTADTGLRDEQGRPVGGFTLPKRLESSESSNDVPDEVTEYFDDAFVVGGNIHKLTDFVAGLLKILPSKMPEAVILKRLMEFGALRKGTIILNEVMQGGVEDLGWFLPMYHHKGQLIEGNTIGISPAAFGKFDTPTSEVSSRLLRTLVHEVMHMATATAIDTNPAFKAELTKLFEAAQRQYAGDINDHYGLRVDVHEFVAEAFSNRKFQQLLAGMQGVAKQSIWQRIGDAIKRFFRMAVPTQNLLNEVMAVTEASLPTFEQRTATVKRLSAELKAYREQQGREFNITNGMEYLKSKGLYDGTTDFAPMGLRELGDAAAMLNATIDNTLSAGSTLSDVLTRGNLGFMDLDVMERKYRNLFQKAANKFGLGHNPLTRLVQSIQRSASAARDLITLGMDAAEVIDQLDGVEKDAVSLVMRDATMARVHPELALSNPLNQHLTTSEELADAREVISKYNALTDKGKAAYKSAKDVLTLAFSRRRKALMRYVGQTASLTDAQLDEFVNITSMQDLEDFEMRHLDSLDANGNLLVLPEGVVSTAQRVIEAGRVKGPYFPLTRDGAIGLVEWDRRTPEDKRIYSVFANQHELDNFVKAQKAAGKPADWNYAVVRVAEQDILPGELKQVAETITAAVKDMAMRDNVRNEIVKMLAEASLHGRSLKRKYVHGVHPESMIGAFRDYVTASSYAIGDMTEGYTIEQDLAHMREMQRSAAQIPGEFDGGPTLTADEAVAVGFVRNEFSKRLQEQARDRNVGAIERAVGLVGFLNFLAAPSYWILNLMQNVTVGVSALASYSNAGYGQAGAAIRNSSAMILKSAKGANLMETGKNIYDIQVLMNVLPDEYAALAKYLFDENVIGSTLAQELGSMLSENPLLKLKPVLAATQVMQAVPQTIEYFNRLSVAFAAYDLAKGSKEARYTAARDVTQMSHFNYSPENRARLLKTFPSFLGGAGEAVVRPIMMFKVYGVNLFRLVYGSAYDALKGDTPEQKTKARRMLMGLLVSHTVLGGVFGGLGLGAVEVLGAAINAMLDDDEEIDWQYEINEYLKEHTNDYIARIITRGAPAALGADMSASINLGNMLFMAPDVQLSDTGGVERMMVALGGPMIGLAARDIREAARFIEGEKTLGSTAELVAKLTPIKMVRDLQDSFAMANGLETENNQSFLQADEVPFTALIMRGMLGLRPAVASQRQLEFYGSRDRTVALERMKSELQAAYISSDNPSDRLRAQERINEFNERARQARNYPLVISSDSLRRARNAREQRQEEYKRKLFTPYNRQ